MTGLIDYGMGNLRSALNALRAVGADVKIIRNSAEFEAVDRVILPGVGAFAAAASKLRESGLAMALREHVIEGGKPFLGICLGMQLLADVSYEHGEHVGFGWIPGEVRRIEPADKGLRVPHMGWNEVRVSHPSPLLSGIGTRPTFYFVHSYHFVCRDHGHAVATVDHGQLLVAIVQDRHIFGVQFHPEKSHKDGLQLLQNFACG